MNSLDALTYDLRVVPIGLIDEPELAMRQSFDEEKLEELADSIRANGVLQNLSLVMQGERFFIAAGHRRYLASIMAGVAEVPARVYPDGTDPELVKVHENAMREDVNPADEAVYYKTLLETRCGGDTIRLANLVGRKQSFVEQRLSLVLGYAEVFEALKANSITMAVAQELNKYGDYKFMLSHLKAAIDGGVKASVVRTWRQQIEMNPSLLGAEPQGDNSDLPAGQAPAPPTMSCVVCGESKDPYNLDFIYIHRGGPCKSLLERFLNNMGGS